MRYLLVAMFASVFLALTVLPLSAHAIIVPPPPLSITACGLATPISSTDKQQNVCIAVSYAHIHIGDTTTSPPVALRFDLIAGITTLGGNTFQAGSGSLIFNTASGLVESIVVNPKDCHLGIWHGIVGVAFTGPGNYPVTFSSPESKLVGFADHAGEDYFLDMTGTLTIS